MKKLLLVLAVGAFVACNNSGALNLPLTLLQKLQTLQLWLQLL